MTRAINNLILKATGHREATNHSGTALELLHGLLDGKVGKRRHEKFEMLVSDFLSEDVCKLIGISRCFKKNNGFVLESSFDQFQLFSAWKATRAFLLILNDFDQEFWLKFTMEEVLHPINLILNYPRDNIIKNLKFHTAFFLAKFMKNELPQRNVEVTNPYLFSGRVRKYLQRRLNSKDPKVFKLCVSFLQGVKRSCERADENFIFKSLSGHRDAMQKVAEKLDPGLQANIAIKADLILKGLVVSDCDAECSRSAAFGVKRSEGGGRGYLLNDENHQYDGELLEMREIKGKVVELRGMSLTTRKFFNIKTRSNAEVHPILEPLKVRLITKGPADRYFYSMKLQKSLFRHLRKFDQFKLIGEPLREEHLYNMVDIENKNFPGVFDSFVSGDYSAATDNLNMNVTRTIFEVCLDYCKDVDKDVFRSVLYGHNISYPKKYSSKLPSVTQTNGQLMGSILSFPILCIANMIALWISLEKYLDCHIQFKQIGALINGDDIGFRTNSDHYEIWKDIVRTFGFDLSVGKNYIHKKYVTLNSQYYSYTEEKFKQFDFFNTGLLLGESKLSDKVSDTVKCLSDAYNKVMRGADNKVQTHNWFIRYNRQRINTLTENGKFNLILSPHQVGGGFDDYGLCNITNFQKRLAIAMQILNREGLISGITEISESNNGNVSYNIERVRNYCINGVGPTYENVFEIRKESYNIKNSGIDDPDQKRPRVSILPHLRDMLKGKTLNKFVNTVINKDPNCEFEQFYAPRFFYRAN
jgi:hypothetical protein